MVTVENVLPVTQGSGAEIADARVQGWSRFVPGGLIALAFFPIVLLHGRELWARPHYQFFPLVIPGAVALVWKWCSRLDRLEPGNPAVSKGAAVIVWLMLAFAVACISPGSGALAALFVLLATAYTLGGWRLMVAAMPAWGLLWLAIPPPKHFDVVLIVKLQNLVSRWSSHLLDLIGVYHMMDGNVVDVGSAPLLVDQACSGVYSLITLLIGTLFYALWVKSSVVRTVLLMGASIVWVLFGNLLRIILVVVLTTRWEINAASGWRHETLGLIMFAMMLGLVFSTDRLLLFIRNSSRWLWATVEDVRRQQVALRTTPDKNPGALKLPRESSSRSRRTIERVGASGKVEAPIPEAIPVAVAPVVLPPRPVETPPELPRTELPDIRRTWLSSWGFATAFGILLVPQLIMPGAHWKDVLLASDVYQGLFKDIDASTTPAQVGPFEFGKFEESDRSKDSSWGEHSKIWIYRGAAVSLDYEFVDWHELTDCYKAQGWVLEKRLVLNPSDPTSKDKNRPYGPVVASWFVNNEGRHKYLLFGLYDRKGRAIEPTDTRSVLTVFGERFKSWFRTGDSGGSDAEVLCFQLQTFIDTETPSKPDLEEAILNLHATIRSRIETLGLKLPAEKEKPR